MKEVTVLKIKTHDKNFLLKIEENRRKCHIQIKNVIDIEKPKTKNLCIKNMTRLQKKMSMARKNVVNVINVRL